jgi:hypothetical protein
LNIPANGASFTPEWETEWAGRFKGMGMLFGWIAH